MSDESDGKGRATGWTDNSGYTQIELYPDGQYKSFVPEIDTEWVIEGQQVKLKADAVVKFFPKGRIERCVVGEGTTLMVFGVRAKLAEGTPVEFRDNGSVRTLTIAAQSSWIPLVVRAWTYRGTSYPPGTTLDFAEDGTITVAGRSRSTKGEP